MHIPSSIDRKNTFRDNLRTVKIRLYMCAATLHPELASHARHRLA